MILSDFDLRSYISSGRLVVEPFWEGVVRENGLDLRLGDRVCVLRSTDRVLDPFREWEESEFYRCFDAGEEFVVEPNSRYLLHSIEYIKLPPELVGFVELRSTLARYGLIIPPTIIDGGFEGQLTIELLSSSFPIKLKPGLRFLHVILAKATTPIEKPYSGKYQGQKGVKLPKILEYP